MTVASYLKRRLVTQRHRTVGEVAAELDITRPSFSKVINGKAALSVELALKIEALTDISAKWLLRSQLDEQIEKARR